MTLDAGEPVLRKRFIPFTCLKICAMEREREPGEATGCRTIGEMLWHRHYFNAGSRTCRTSIVITEEPQISPNSPAAAPGFFEPAPASTQKMQIPHVHAVEVLPGCRHAFLHV